MILFILAGFGYGNASRQLAIIREIRRRQPALPITVFSWGKGYEFLVTEKGSLNFNLLTLKSGNRFSFSSYGLSIVTAALTYLFWYPANLYCLKKWAIRNRPKVIVFDSDYHMPAFIFFKARRICVNQAPMVCAAGKKFKFSFIVGNGFFLSYLIENLDFLIQSLFADKILVPQIPGSEIVHDRKIVPIPLIVRDEFLISGSGGARRRRGPALVLGGSGTDANGLRAWSKNKGVRLFEKDKAQENLSGSLAEELQDYSPVIVQAGLSSISECIAMGKYMFILPVAKHWEQYINSEEVTRLKLGRRLKLEELDLALANFSYEHEDVIFDKSHCAGAAIAASLILKELRDEV